MSDTQVNINLNVQGQGSGPRVLQEAEQATKRLSQAEKEYQNELRRRGDQGGGLGGLALYAKAAAGVALVSHSMSQLAKAAEIYNNSLLTEGQRRRALAESVPLVGGLVKSFNDFRDATNGVTDAIARSAERMRMAAAELARTASFEAGVIGAHGVLGPATTAAGAWERVGVRDFTAGIPDASRVREYEAFERMLPGREAAVRAERRREAQLGLGRYWAEQRRGTVVERQQAETAAQMREAMAHNADVDFRAGRGDRGIVIGAAQNAISAQNEYKHYLQQNIEMLGRERDAALGAANAESEARKANISQLQTKLQLLKEEEQRSRGTTIAFANMSQAERSLAIGYARQAKEKGFESLIPAQRELLRRAGAGEFVEQGLERMGANDPLTREFQGLIGQRQLSQVRAEKVQTTAQINLQVQLDEKALAEQVKQVMEGYFRDVKAELEKVRQADKNISLLEQILRRAGQGGG
jgi:hypothetical protein